MPEATDATFTGDAVVMAVEVDWEATSAAMPMTVVEGTEAATGATATAAPVDERPPAVLAADAGADAAAGAALNQPNRRTPTPAAERAG